MAGLSGADEFAHGFLQGVEIVGSIRLECFLWAASGPAHWVGELPDRAAADSIVNRLANHARTINLGQIDMRRIRHDQARADQGYRE